MKRNFLFTLFTLLLFTMLNAQRDFDLVKQRVLSEILQSTTKDSSVTRLMETLADDGSWPGVNYAGCLQYRL